MRLNAADVSDVLAALALVEEPVPIHFLGGLFWQTQKMNMFWIWL
jgi:hypothetical protein